MLRFLSWTPAQTTGFAKGPVNPLTGMGRGGRAGQRYRLYLQAPPRSVFWLANTVSPQFPARCGSGGSYLGVPHAGRSDQCLLDGVALLEHALLLPCHGPVALDQELHHLQVSSESSVNQSALTIFVQMIHLEQRRQNTMKPKHEQNIFASSEFPAPVAK